MTGEYDPDDLGFVSASKHRKQTLKRLYESPCTPTELAEDCDLVVSHVSRAIGPMRERDLVELLVPEARRKGRVYGITDEGEAIAEVIGVDGGGDG